MLIKKVKIILENDYSVVMNLKKIHRLRNKYDLVANGRSPNPDKQMAKANQGRKTNLNISNCDIDKQEPLKALFTDIT